MRFGFQNSPNAALKSLEIAICGIPAQHLVSSLALISPNASNLASNDGRCPALHTLGTSQRYVLTYFLDELVTQQQQ